MNETTELIMKQLNSKKVHAETHEVGGGDEIDVTKLKNIEDYVTIDGDFAGTWNGVAMTSVEPGLSSAFNALKAETVTGIFNVVTHYGAKGDGVTDDTAAIQSAADAMYAARNVLASGISSTLYFPTPSSFYKISAPINILTDYINIEGSSKGARIKNVGTGAAFTVTATYVSFKKMGIWGNGGAYGVGATGTYGIDLNASSHVTLDDVDIRYHGNHGVYVRGGGWNLSIINSKISQNLGDGIKSVSPSGSEQNGNAMSIVNSAIFNNTQNGLNWKAAGLNVNGSNIEGNKGAGILIDCTGLTNSAYGISVTGNEFESNNLGQIKFVNITGNTVFGANIEGNYFFSNYAGSDGATALIVASGPVYTMQHVNIGKNGYSMVGAKVVNWVDLGSCPRASCTVDTSNNQTIFVNLGQAKGLYVKKTRAINGLFDQSGFAYSGIEKSDNIYAMGTKRGYFHLPIFEGEILNRLSFYSETNCTDSYTVSIYVQGSDQTGTGTVATIAGTSFTYSSGGNHLVDWDLTSTYGTYRHLKNYNLFLRVDITNPATGSTMYIHDVIMEII